MQSLKTSFILHLWPLEDGKDLWPANNDDRWTCILGNGRRQWAWEMNNCRVIWVFSLALSNRDGSDMLCLNTQLCSHAGAAPLCNAFSRIWDIYRMPLEMGQRRDEQLWRDVIQHSKRIGKRKFWGKLFFFSSLLNVIEKDCLWSPGDWHLLWSEGGFLFILTYLLFFCHFWNPCRL